MKTNLNVRFALLRTYEPSPLLKEHGKLFFSKKFGFDQFDVKKNFEHWNTYHLYVLIDSYLRVGDYVFDHHKGVHTYDGENGPFRGYKIIASTDPSLGLFGISDGFLEVYIWKFNTDASGHIEDAVVEYDAGRPIVTEVESKRLRVDPDNTLYITRKNTNYDFKKVVELIEEAVKVTHEWSRDNDDVHSLEIIKGRILDWWIENNV